MATLTKDQAAQDLANAHFSVEPGLRQVFRLLAPKKVEENPKEPIKLLEVNEDAVPCGILPVFFGSDAQTPFPSVVVDVTPEEYGKIVKDELKLPNEWQIDQEYERSTANAQG